MTNTKQKTTDSEICSIRIVFPVDSDEQAIEYKKKIAEVLSEIPDAQINFSLMSGMVQPPTV